MSDEPGNRKPDGSAWKAHMDGLAARNDAARKAGRQERQAHERSKNAALRAADLRQTAELRARANRRGTAASLLRSDKQR